MKRISILAAIALMAAPALALPKSGPDMTGTPAAAGTAPADQAKPEPKPKPKTEARLLDLAWVARLKR